MCLRDIGVDAPRHPVQPQMMHGPERQVESDEQQREIPHSELFIEHSAGPLREPVIKCSEQRENRAADQHVMQMSDDEHGVMYLQIKLNRREDHSREPADDEDGDEPEHEDHRHAQPDAP